MKDRPQANRHRKLDDRGEAQFGLQPAAQGMTTGPCALAQGGGVEAGILHVPRRGAQASKKNALKPWQKREWCIPKVSAEFVANMEDLLDLYAVAVVLYLDPVVG